MYFVILHQLLMGYLTEALATRRLRELDQWNNQGFIHSRVLERHIDCCYSTLVTNNNYIKQVFKKEE